MEQSSPDEVYDTRLSTILYMLKKSDSLDCGGFLTEREDRLNFYRFVSFLLLIKNWVVKINHQ